MAVAHARAAGVAWGRVREPAMRGAQLLAVSGFALAQPLFDILGKNAEFFAVRGSTAGEILLFALVVTFAPALGLLALELSVSLFSPTAARVLHHVFLAFLGALFGVQALRRAGMADTAALVAGAVVIGLVVALAAWRLRPARSFLTLLSAAPIVFLALFLLNTPVERLIFQSGARAAAIRTEARTPVVFLLFDEFPVIDLQQGDGTIDAGRFPNFARLAASSTWFRNTTTISASTTVAVPAILTGQRPKKGALPVYQDHPDNLFTLLGRRYRLQVTESQTRLCPPRLCKRSTGEAGDSSLFSDVRTVYLHLIAPPALEDRLPAIDESWGNFGASSTTAAGAGGGHPPKVDLSTFYLSRVRDFHRFVASFRAPARRQPTLYFLHVLLPHAPWLYFPDGTGRAVARTNAPGRIGERWVDPALAEQAWQRLLLQTGYTDRLLGVFLRRLHATGLWRRALVIVTADHGISFRGGDLRRRPTRTNLAELAFTPLFVKLPGQDRGRVVDRHVQTLDILPTIADVLGIRIPWQTDGSSALDRRAGSSRVDVAGVSAPYAVALRQRRTSLERQLALFGTGTWGARLSATGPYWTLVGRPVGELQVLGSLAAKASVDSLGSKLLRALPKRMQLVPSPLSGTISGLRAGTTLAFALNGRMAALTQAYRDRGGGLRFSALAPDSAFRPGRNTLRAFVVSGPVSAPALREVRVALS